MFSGEIFLVGRGRGLIERIFQCENSHGDREFSMKGEPDFLTLFKEG